MTIKRGSTAVKIYRSEVGAYETFTLAYYDGSKRKRQNLSDFAEAKREAESIATKLCRGELDVLTLSSEDRALYVRACEALRPMSVSLDLAALEYTEARKRLGTVPLLEAVDYYVRHSPRTLPRKNVHEVHVEMLQAKEGDGCSAAYLKDLRFRVGKFCDAFHCSLADVRVVDINEYLRSLDCSGRSRNNSRMSINTLFKFAEASGYLPKGHLDFDQVAKAKEGESEIEIFTLREMDALLTSALNSRQDVRPGVNQRYTARNDLLVYLSLGAFAGLRTAEIQRQRWEDINLDRGFIRVTAAKGHTAQKRLVPIQDNLRRWLLLCWRPEGLCCEYRNLTAAMYRIAEKAGVEWKHNALRHSYISNRVAQTQSIPQAALEAGNSVAMVNRHYRELVTPDEAKAWFSIQPDESAKVVPMSLGAIQNEGEFVTNLSRKQGQLL